VEDPVQSLLRVCTTHEVLPWSAFLANPPFLCRGEAQKGRQAVITKTGEASYSEVYGITAAESAGVVVKVIPLISSEPVQFKKRITQEDYPDCSEPKDVAREIEITRRMSELPQGGFVEFLQYVRIIFNDANDFADASCSEHLSLRVITRMCCSSNGTSTSPPTAPTPSDLVRHFHLPVCQDTPDRPDCFPTLQKFAVIVLSHGGPDLERFRFDTTHGWIQAAGVFFQVAAALARAEEWTEFEVSISSLLPCLD
jgi:serine/threonine-protein kinase haspin